MNALPLDPLSGFSQLKNYLLAHTGLAYYRDKDTELKHKFQKRMSDLHLETYLDYLRHLDSVQGQTERESLIQELTIGETYFFRHQEQFAALKDEVFPEILTSQAGQQRLSIWSAGCATGEEPYSLAILLQQHFSQLQHWQVQILGTDINRESLAQAQRAQYRKWSFRNNSEAFQNSCFYPVEQNWELLPSYRKWVRFQQHNLIQDDFSLLAAEGSLDLIICRNVLIYFDEDTLRRLISQFHRFLQPEGWLVLGPAELTPLSCQPFSATPLSRLSCFRKSPAPTDTRPQNTHQWSLPLLSEFFQTENKPTTTVLPLTQNLFPWLPLPRPQEVPVPQAAENLSPSPPDVSPSRQPPQALALLRQLADQGEFTEVALTCRKLLQREPLNPRLHYYLALALSGQGQIQAAQASLQQALYLDRKHILSHYHLGLLLQKKQDLKAAARAFRNAFKLLQALPEEDVLEEESELTVAQLKASILLHQREIS